MNLSNLEKMIKQKGFLKKDFLKHIEMTNNGFDQMINNGTVKVTTLEKIAKVLNVPVGVFFDDSFKIENWNPAEDVKNDFAKENEALKREIELFREINELLKKER